MERLRFPLKLFYESYIAPAGPFFQPQEYPDLTGKKWLVTGATGGIGLETVKVLSKLGAELWIVGRDDKKLAAVCNILDEQTHGRPLVHSLVADFDNLDTLRPAVDKLKQQTKHLDGIIHNIGLMNVPQGRRTKQDIDETIGVNNVATQLLQDLLDPLIENSKDGRIVWLSSVAMALAPRGGFDLVTLANGNPGRVYAMSKAWTYFQAVSWTRRHPNSPVKSIAVHPGLIQSGLTRTTSYFQTLIFNRFAYSTEIGALPPLYAALYPKIKNNDYIIPYGRSGLVRPDLYRAARGTGGDAAMAWIDEQLKSYK